MSKVSLIFFNRKSGKKWNSPSLQLRSDRFPDPGVAAPAAPANPTPAAPAAPAVPTVAAPGEVKNAEVKTADDAIGKEPDGPGAATEKVSDPGKTNQQALSKRSAPVKAKITSSEPAAKKEAEDVA